MATLSIGIHLWWPVMTRIFSHVFMDIAVALFENLLPTLSYYLGSNGWSCVAKHPYFVVLP